MANGKRSWGDRIKGFARTAGDAASVVAAQQVQQAAAAQNAPAAVQAVGTPFTQRLSAWLRGLFHFLTRADEIGIAEMLVMLLNEKEIKIWRAVMKKLKVQKNYDVDQLERELLNRHISHQETWKQGKDRYDFVESNPAYIILETVIYAEGNKIKKAEEYLVEDINLLTKRALFLYGTRNKFEVKLRITSVVLLIVGLIIGFFIWLF